MKTIIKKFLWVIFIILPLLINISLTGYEIYKYFFYFPQFNIDKDYKTNALWNENCWVRSLDKLNELRKNPDIEEMWCIGGQMGIGHMWIAYRLKNKRIILYDPVYERFKEVK